MGTKAGQQYQAAKQHKMLATKVAELLSHIMPPCTHGLEQAHNDEYVTFLGAVIKATRTFRRGAVHVAHATQEPQDDTNDASAPGALEEQMMDAEFVRGLIHPEVNPLSEQPKPLEKTRALKQVMIDGAFWSWPEFFAEQRLEIIVQYGSPSMLSTALGLATLACLRGFHRVFGSHIDGVTPGKYMFADLAIDVTTVDDGGESPWFNNVYEQTANYGDSKDGCLTAIMMFARAKWLKLGVDAGAQTEAFEKRLLNVGISTGNVDDIVDLRSTYINGNGNVSSARLHLARALTVLAGDAAHTMNDLFHGTEATAEKLLSEGDTLAQGGQVGLLSSMVFALLVTPPGTIGIYDLGHDQDSSQHAAACLGRGALPPAVVVFDWETDTLRTALLVACFDVQVEADTSEAVGPTPLIMLLGTEQEASSELTHVPQSSDARHVLQKHVKDKSADGTGMRKLNHATNLIPGQCRRTHTLHAPSCLTACRVHVVRHDHVHVVVVRPRELLSAPCALCAVHRVPSLVPLLLPGPDAT